MTNAVVLITDSAWDVTVIAPEVATAGTEVVMLVAVEDVTTADIPLKSTNGVASKLVPVITTTFPAVPHIGEMLVMVGDAVVRSGLTLTVTSKDKV